jgi:hypothetical protein
MSGRERSAGDRVSRVIFGLFTLGALAVLAQALRMLGPDAAWAHTLLAWGGGALVVGAVPLFLSPSLRANLAVSLVMVVVCAYAFNAYLAYSPPPNVAAVRALEEARRAVPGFDHRTTLQVVRDLRADGVPAVPALLANYALDEHKDPRALLPLSGIATATTVLCNESGQFAIFPADEHGFNNPRGLPEETDVVLVGDSFVQGQCVPPGMDVAGALRKRGYRAVNAGCGGNGPLLSLAALVEYGLPRKPKVVIWGFAGNDHHDMQAELLDGLLVRYRDEPDFSQGLLGRQGEIDAYWQDYLQRKRSFETPKDEVRGAVRAWEQAPPRMSELATLYSLRRLLGLRRGGTSVPWDVHYRPILKRAQAAAEAAGAKFYLVSFPHYELVQKGFKEEQLIHRVAREEGVETVDFLKRILEQPDPLALYPLRLAGHFNEAGYDLLAQQLVDEVLAPMRSPPTAP